jgi:23S rRNA pseudouridine1911/1915/1917 synthase
VKGFRFFGRERGELQGGRGRRELEIRRFGTTSVPVGDNRIIEAKVADDAAGWRLDRALAAAVPTLSRERLKALISSGAVAGPQGQPVRDPAVKAVPGGTYTVAVPEPRPAHNEAQDLALHVVHEDEHLLVVDKPAGMVVHPAAGNLDGTLVNALLHHCAGRLSGIGGVARPGIVHRIDKDTSGLLVVAKTDVAHEGLAAQFARHSIHRAYAALVAGLPNPASGSVDAPLARSTANRKKMAVVAEGRGKRAVTHYRLVRPLRAASLVECRLETGRTHQVRVHMASIGHPLLGDPVYGRSRPEHREVLKRLGFQRQALHAAELGFLHPVSKENLSFKSALPSDIQELLGALTV